MAHPFPTYDQKEYLEPGRYEDLVLESIDVWSGTSPKDGKPYNSLIYTFTDPASGKCVKNWCGAGYLRGKNRQLVEMLSKNGIPDSATVGPDKFWDYSQTLIGSHYVCNVTLNEKGKTNVSSAMWKSGPLQADKQKQATAKASAPVSLSEDEIPW